MAEFNTWNHLEFNNSEGGLFCTYTNQNGAKVATALRRIFPSYGTQFPQSIELIEAGPLEGSIVCQTPKTFEIVCGEVPSGTTEDQAGIAGVWYAANGDIVLAAPKGAVRIIAQDIELIAQGDPNDNKGHVSVAAAGDFRSETHNVKMHASELMGLTGEDNIIVSTNNKVTVEGTFQVNEGSDPITAISSFGSGSKTPFQWAEFAERFVKSLKSAI
tara:strand:+ start:425 stop:1072 length:648 start_codon:yes stop_codon:yes gene_type:complete